MKLQNEEFNNFMLHKIFYGNETQENELGGTCSTKGRVRYWFSSLGESPENKW